MQKINERLKENKTGTEQPYKVNCQQGVPPPTPFISSFSPQDVIITANMLLVTNLQYLSRFMWKNKTVFLHSCNSKKGCLISEPLPLDEEVSLPLSASTPVSPLMPVTLSGLMSLDCLDPGFTKTLRSTARHIGLKLWGYTWKKKRRMFWTCPHIFKHSQNNTVLMGRHSTLGASIMLAE